MPKGVNGGLGFLALGAIPTGPPFLSPLWATEFVVAGGALASTDWATPGFDACCGASADCIGGAGCFFMLAPKVASLRPSVGAGYSNVALLGPEGRGRAT